MTVRGTTVMPRCSTRSGARSAVESVTIATLGIGGPAANHSARPSSGWCRFLSPPRAAHLVCSGNGAITGPRKAVRPQGTLHLLFLCWDQPTEDPAAQYAHSDQSHQDECRRTHCEDVDAESCCHADSGHHPDGGRRREALHAASLAQDGAGAEKADACDHLGGNPGRVDTTGEHRGTQQGEEARATRHHGHGAEAGSVAAPLTLQADDGPQDERHHDPEQQLRLLFGAQLFEGPRPLPPGSSGRSGRFRLLTRSRKTARRSSSSFSGTCSSSSFSGMTPARSSTSVLTKIGQPKRTASAMASLGRESTSNSRPSCLKWRRAKKTSSVREVTTIRLTEIPSSPNVDIIRSWVIGRSGAIPWIFIAMALASNGPIQIGR